ncbi:ribonuclease H protein [Artemisia annua]|uniref:Ribonuclease H protein n=1 Tax=Artemisia annua TaxID=35608 RepID=A0A2U1MPP1_ARTAN|nr:ribonuclease H protein [Artemisia annua]
MFPLPAQVNKQLESIRARFFWGIDDNEKKIQWVKWEAILNAKEKGGLGVGSLWAFNQTLIFKWRWRFLNGNDLLWGWNINWRREIRGGAELSQHSQLMSCIQNMCTNLDQDTWQWKFGDEESFTVRIAMWLDLHIPEFVNIADMFEWIDEHDGGSKQWRILNTTCVTVIWILWMYRNSVAGAEGGTGFPLGSILSHIPSRSCDEPVVSGFLGFGCVDIVVMSPRLVEKVGMIRRVASIKMKSFFHGVIVDEKAIMR